MKNKSKIMRYGVYIVFFIITNALIIDVSSMKSSLVLITFIVNINCMLFLIFYNNKMKPYSLSNIFTLFFLFFLGIAPMLQYQKDIVLWSEEPFSDSQYLKLNTIIFIIFIGYHVLYHKKYNKKIKLKRIDVESNVEEKKINTNTLLLLSVLSSLIILYRNDFNIVNMIFRTGSSKELNTTLELIFSTLIVPIPAVCLIIFKMSRKKDYLIEFLMIILLIITNFPTALARFYIASIYIPLVIIYVPLFRKRKYLFSIAFILGLLIVFPFLNQFRNISGEFQFRIKFDLNMFLEGHFDSYQMFMRVVSTRTITYGRQLLGSILFFIPRSLWMNKPIGSGAYIAEIYDLSFSNISMNFFGEGYINFGYVGILLFLVVIVKITVKLDYEYWSKDKKIGFKVTYLLMLGMFFFMLRGDLLSSLSYMIGIILCITLVTAISQKPK